jgi:hypothetical protein
VLNESKSNKAVLNQNQGMLNEQRMQFNEYFQRCRKQMKKNRKQIMALIENQQPMMNQLAQPISQGLAERDKKEEDEFFRDLFKLVFAKVVTNSMF